MKRLIREPLFHFLLLGAALFAIDALWSERTTSDVGGEIVVSEGRIENLTALFAKTWQRPPTTEELRGLVDDFVLEEALYREGKALGVDQDDTVIRRRVRQKMEFVVDDIIEQAEPADADLEAWLAGHPESYARAERYRFRQVYLNPDRRGDDVVADARRILEKLRAMDEDTDPRGLGDPSSLEHAFADASVQVIASTFGEGFAEDLSEFPIGEWSGPVESAFGLHLVRVDGHTEAQRPPLDDVRAEVQRDWADARRAEASKRYYDGILDRYRVVIEWPEVADDSTEPPSP